MLIVISFYKKNESMLQNCIFVEFLQNIKRGVKEGIALENAMTLLGQLI